MDDNLLTYQFCGARMQMRYGSRYNQAREPETPCKVHPYSDYGSDSFVLGYSFSTEGNVCVFLRHEYPDRNVYKWLNNFEKKQFDLFLSRHAQDLREERCHIIVYTGAEESYGCDGFWLKEEKRLYEMFA
jgi:hypothetical protein